MNREEQIQEARRLRQRIKKVKAELHGPLPHSHPKHAHPEYQGTFICEAWEGGQVVWAYAMSNPIVDNGVDAILDIDFSMLSPSITIWPDPLDIPADAREEMKETGHDPYLDLLGCSRDDFYRNLGKLNEALQFLATEHHPLPSFHVCLDLAAQIITDYRKQKTFRIIAFSPGSPSLNGEYEITAYTEIDARVIAFCLHNKPNTNSIEVGNVEAAKIWTKVLP